VGGEGGTDARFSWRAREASDPSKEARRRRLGRFHGRGGPEKKTRPALGIYDVGPKDIWTHCFSLGEAPVSATITSSQSAKIRKIPFFADHSGRLSSAPAASVIVEPFGLLGRRVLAGDVQFEDDAVMQQAGRWAAAVVIRIIGRSAPT